MNEEIIICLTTVLHITNFFFLSLRELEETFSPPRGILDLDQQFSKV